MSRLFLAPVIVVVMGVAVESTSVVGPATASQLPTPTCHGHRATIFGGGTLVGTPHRDVIVGTNAYSQTIRARGGNDLVCAGPGGSKVFGGGGDDHLYGQADYVGSGEAIGDELSGGPGDDLLDPGFDPRQASAEDLEDRRGDGFSFDGAAHGVSVDLAAGRATGQGKDRLVVEPGWDTLVGTTHDDVLRGTASRDEIHPGSGADIVLGRAGDDVIRGASGDDRLDGGPGDDYMDATRGNVTFNGGSGDDQVGVVGKDPGDQVTVSTGPGDDEVTLYQLLDGETVDGGEGADTLTAYVDDEHVAVVGDLATGAFGHGADSATYRAFEQWNLYGLGPLVVTGTEGPDSLETLSDGVYAHLLGGDDVITSGTGNRESDDFVDGGDGVDSADLGDGEDFCARVENGPC